MQFPKIVINIMINSNIPNGIVTPNDKLGSSPVVGVLPFSFERLVVDVLHTSYLVVISPPKVVVTIVGVVSNNVPILLGTVKIEGAAAAVTTAGGWTLVCGGVTLTHTIVAF